MSNLDSLYNALFQSEDEKWITLSHTVDKIGANSETFSEELNTLNDKLKNLNDSDEGVIKTSSTFLDAIYDALEKHPKSDDSSTYIRGIRTLYENTSPDDYGEITFTNFFGDADTSTPPEWTLIDTNYTSATESEKAFTNFNNPITTDENLMQNVNIIKHINSKLNYPTPSIDMTASGDEVYAKNTNYFFEALHRGATTRIIQANNDQDQIDTSNAYYSYEAGKYYYCYDMATFKTNTTDAYTNLAADFKAGFQSLVASNAATMQDKQKMALYDLYEIVNLLYKEAQSVLAAQQNSAIEISTNIELIKPIQTMYKEAFPEYDEADKIPDNIKQLPGDISYDVVARDINSKGVFVRTIIQYNIISENNLTQWLKSYDQIWKNNEYTEFIEGDPTYSFNKILENRNAIHQKIWNLFNGVDADGNKLAISEYQRQAAILEKRLKIKDIIKVSENRYYPAFISEEFIPNAYIDNVTDSDNPVIIYSKEEV